MKILMKRISLTGLQGLFLTQSVCRREGKQLDGSRYADSQLGFRFLIMDIPKLNQLLIDYSAHCSDPKAVCAALDDASKLLARSEELRCASTPISATRAQSRYPHAQG